MKIPARTPPDLVAAATLGARIATRARMMMGEDGDTVRRDVIARFRRELAGESYGEMTDETLMAAVQRGIAAILDEMGVNAPEYGDFEEPSWRS